MLVVVLIMLVVLRMVAVLDGGHRSGTNAALRLHAWRKIGFGCHV